MVENIIRFKLKRLVMDDRYQFRIDVPRLTLFIDGEGPIETSNPPTVWERLVDHFGYIGAGHCGHYLTQTCLAAHYIAECKFMDEDEYLLSTNLHQVYVNTIKKTVTVKKRFRMTRMLGSSMYDLDTCTLTLKYLIDEKREMEPRWDYLIRNYYRQYNDQVYDDDFVLV